MKPFTRSRPDRSAACVRTALASGLLGIALTFSSPVHTADNSIAALTPQRLFDWAEAAHPHLLPSRQSNIAYPPYVYRYYPETQSYLAVDGNNVLFLGPATGHQILPVGKMSDFACLVSSETCSASPLANRTWEPGRKIASGEADIEDLSAGLADNGDAHVIFVRMANGRPVLHAVQGSPGPTAGASSFGPVVAIDGGLSPLGAPRLAVAPNGDAVVVWRASAACNATTYKTSGSCNYLHFARYSSATGSWGGVVRGPDSPADPGSIVLSSRGDLAFLMTGWTRRGTSLHDAHETVAWQASGSATIRQRLFSDVRLSKLTLAIDGAGDWILAAEASQNATKDIVVYRGTSASVGPQEVLDTRGAEAGLGSVARGLRGETLVIWRQNNGTRPANYAASSATSQGPFQVQELAFRLTGGLTKAVVTDYGAMYAYEFSTRQVQRMSEGVWSSVEALPTSLADGASYNNTFTRNGQLLTVKDFQGFCHKGLWSAYDPEFAGMVRPMNSSGGSDNWVLKFNTCTKGIGEQAPLVSTSGVGLQLMRNSFDTLPSPAEPNGDLRTGIRNLWGVFFR
ncbi:hypothetical protein HLB44_29895 [Aquincola sp. S2]|uniref:Uncharacterized protein n=1 Tax=Pseudaquabacterium terrae TaxID=2732868 RepID=A0ABX2ERY2_9BURK|nr:hypothetical protein [Aquabacterium terrae]NRF71214.1 hypothetical protein [Aquabacterium terrae]